jgi:hypothetical protein
VIRQKTRPGQHYDAEVHFRGCDGDRLRFDLWISAEDGQPCEMIRGLSMRDVSGGRLQPPAWIKASNALS